MDKVTAMGMKGVFFICPLCLKGDDYGEPPKEVIIHPDDKKCSACGWKINLKLAVKVHETELDEDTVLEQTFVPLDLEGEVYEDCWEELTEDEIMEMPEGNEEADVYLEELKQKHNAKGGRATHKLIKSTHSRLTQSKEERIWETKN